MKKLTLISMLLLTTTLSTCTLADEPVCNSSERHWATDSRFFDIGISSSDGSTTGHFFDLETIKIDKKNKIIKVWVIRVASEKGRAKFSKFNGFSNYGYQKMLWTVDYVNMKIKTNPSTFMDCDGSSITTLLDDGKWEELYPSSINELVVEEIIKKYNLK